MYAPPPPSAFLPGVGYSFAGPRVATPTPAPPRHRLQLDQSHLLPPLPTDTRRCRAPQHLPPPQQHRYRRRQKLARARHHHRRLAGRPRRIGRRRGRSRPAARRGERRASSPQTPLSSHHPVQQFRPLSSRGCPPRAPFSTTLTTTEGGQRTHRLRLAPAMKPSWLLERVRGFFK